MLRHLANIPCAININATGENTSSPAYGWLGAPGCEEPRIINLSVHTLGTKARELCRKARWTRQWRCSVISSIRSPLTHMGPVIIGSADGLLSSTSRENKREGQMWLSVALCASTVGRHETQSLLQISVLTDWTCLFQCVTMQGYDCTCSHTHVTVKLSTQIRWIYLALGHRREGNSFEKGGSNRRRL